MKFPDYLPNIQKEKKKFVKFHNNFIRYITPIAYSVYLGSSSCWKRHDERYNIWLYSGPNICLIDLEEAEEDHYKIWSYAYNIASFEDEFYKQGRKVEDVIFQLIDIQDQL